MYHTNKNQTFIEMLYQSPDKAPFQLFSKFNSVCLCLLFSLCLWIFKFVIQELDFEDPCESLPPQNTAGFYDFIILCV